MDFYKMKFKMKFRVKKVKGFFTLCKYNFLHKFNLEGNAQFYYHLQRKLLRDLIRTTAEHEYLEEHGLLPEEPEPEEELEPEPEEEPEPGLIRKFDFLDLMHFSFSVGKTTYCVDELKEFEDRTEITMKMLEDYGEVEWTEQAVVPHEDGARHDPFTMNGVAFRWDRLDAKLRVLPVVYEDADVAAAEQGRARPVQGMVLRMGKAQAEERLSPLCLEYAYQCTQEGYDWCMLDHSHTPVLYELNAWKDKVGEYLIIRNLGGYCPHYFEEAGLDKYSF
jgi:hypothetical protein